MKVTFTYNKQKDIWCLLNKGKSSSNSQSPTKVYEQLIAQYGENPTPEQASDFIDKYIADNKIDLPEYITKYQNDWDEAADEYQKRAEAIFGVSLPSDVVGYLTINNRCPYSIENNYFFVAVPTKSSRRTTMHELWHFYTWYGLGVDQEQKLGDRKYNDIKESLSVLIDEECKDLLPEGVSDSSASYPQHQELRKNIVEFWEKEKDIKKLWEYFSQKTT